MASINIARQNIQTPQKAYDDMFGISTKDPHANVVVEIEIDKLIPYTDQDGSSQPFKLYGENDLNNLIESIKNNGVLEPIIVRPIADGNYQIIAGHNRTNACKLAKLTTVPSIVKDVDDDVATLIMVDTNLNQRQKLLPSEKATAYKIQKECLSKISNSSTNEISKMTGESLKSIQRYLSLSLLENNLLKLVDDERIQIVAGVELSHLTEHNQEQLGMYMYLKDNSNIKINLYKAKKIIALEKETDKNFNAEYLDKIFKLPSTNEKENEKFEIKFSKVKEFLPSEMSPQEVEAYILNALDFFSKINKTRPANATANTTMEESDV